MRILITGGAGFLGSHLCEAFIAEGHSVVAVDNLLTGSLDNLAELDSAPRFDFVEADVTEPFDFGPVDQVLNFASPASPVDYTQHGIETLKVGSLGTFNTLEIARKYGARYLLASTSECYGDPTVHPQREDYWGNVNPIGPRSVYDEAKRFAEAAVSANLRYHNVNTAIIRIFNTYGPRLQLTDGRVISNFMSQALSGDDLTVYGNGQQTRSFCYVSDLIEGILRIAASTEHAPINLGNDTEFTVLECAKAVLSVTGATSQVKFLPPLPDDPKQRRPDLSRARSVLGWEPKVDLLAGLRLCLPYFQARIASQQQKLASI
jgi:dTDP-glucose 4,6-dehydratase